MLLDDGNDLTESNLVESDSYDDPEQEQDVLSRRLGSNITIAYGRKYLERPVHTEEVLQRVRLTLVLRHPAQPSVWIIDCYGGSSGLILHVVDGELCTQVPEATDQVHHQEH